MRVDHDGDNNMPPQSMSTALSVMLAARSGRIRSQEVVALDC
jgi:hypothetical protein